MEGCVSSGMGSDGNGADLTSLRGVAFLRKVLPGKQ